MPSAHLNLKEEDVIKLTLEFLQQRSLHITQLSLERETGIINGCHSDDALFLRQLILDGQWDDAVEFVQPLEAIDTFERQKFYFTVLKYKYFELLCIKTEAPSSNSNNEAAVQELVKVLEELEKCAPSKDSYSQLCLYLTLPHLHEHPDFKEWNPSSARVHCWTQVYPLVDKFLPAEKKSGLAGAGEGVGMAKNDRLVQLIIKGLLYESCVDYCQAQATGDGNAGATLKFPSLLSTTLFSDSDLSLLSWLQSIPAETFSCPFEQKTLNVDVERVEKPSLEASWTEHLLITPIKPKTFPHSAMPYGRPKATDLMSRSLNPNLVGVPLGIQGANNSSMVASAGDINLMSKSIASFHLTGKKTMNTSVDRLFDTENVFASSSCGDLPPISEKDPAHLPRPPPRRARSKSPDKRHSTDSLNRPLPDSADEKPPSPPTPESAKVSSPSVCQTITQPKLTIALDSRDAHSVPPKPPYPPFGVNLPPGYQESSELFNIYQKRQQVMNQHILDQYGNNNTVVPPTIHPANINGNRMANYIPGNMNLTANGYGIQNNFSYHPVYDSLRGGESKDEQKPRFLSVTRLEDVQAIRCAEFHPSGHFYAVGSNSKNLRICAYPKLNELRDDHVASQPTVILKRTKHHKGSIYCLSWSPLGDLIATGSNDKTVKLMKFNAETCSVEGQEIELTMHDGTVRDLCFVEDSSNKSSLLISGGAGDCKIYVTDCTTGTPFQALAGHTGHILSLYTWGGAMFVSGSQDRSVRFWDLRSRGCVNVISPSATPTKPGAPVASVCVDPSGRLLVSGHEDSVCSLYDIRGARMIQAFRPHATDVRSIRFSPSAYYLLTAGYDNKLVLTDLQGDLTLPLPCVVVAEHTDKAICGRWHPSDFSFISTSADKTCILWALPPV